MKIPDATDGLQEALTPQPLFSTEGASFHSLGRSPRFRGKHPIVALKGRHSHSRRRSSRVGERTETHITVSGQTALRRFKDEC